VDALRCDELGLEDQIIRIENDGLAHTPRPFDQVRERRRHRQPIEKDDVVSQRRSGVNACFLKPFRDFGLVSEHLQLFAQVKTAVACGGRDRTTASQEKAHRSSR
jgi:hypothetical protein